MSSSGKKSRHRNEKGKQTYHSLASYDTREDHHPSDSASITCCQQCFGTQRTLQWTVWYILGLNIAALVAHLIIIFLLAFWQLDLLVKMRQFPPIYLTTTGVRAQFPNGTVPTEDTDPGNLVQVPILVRTNMALQIKTLLYTFEAITIVAHTCYVCLCIWDSKLYPNLSLLRGINYIRWVEYAASTSTMVIAIALATGQRDLTTVLLQAFMIIVVMLAGGIGPTLALRRFNPPVFYPMTYGQEKPQLHRVHAAAAKLPDPNGSKRWQLWLPVVLASWLMVVFVFVPVFIAVDQVTSPPVDDLESDTEFESTIKATVATLFIFFNIFGIVQRIKITKEARLLRKAAQARAAGDNQAELVWEWKRRRLYSRSEVACIMLSFTSKLNMVFLVATSVSYQPHPIDIT